MGIVLQVVLLQVPAVLAIVLRLVHLQIPHPVGIVLHLVIPAAVLLLTVPAAVLLLRQVRHPQVLYRPVLVVIHHLQVLHLVIPVVAHLGTVHLHRQIHRVVAPLLGYPLPVVVQVYLVRHRAKFKIYDGLHEKGYTT